MQAKGAELLQQRYKVQPSSYDAAEPADEKSLLRPRCRTSPPSVGSCTAEGPGVQQG